MDRSDTDLIEACLAGDARAWETLTRRYARLVYSIPRRYGFPDADCEDVLQTVMTSLFRRLDALRDHDRLASWLAVTAHRTCWRLSRDTKGETMLPAVDPAPPPEETLAAWERQHQVRAALRELGSPCRELLEALFLSPAVQSYEVIAGRLGMKVGTIGSARARCFAKLRLILERMGLRDAGGERS